MSTLIVHIIVASVCKKNFKKVRAFQLSQLLKFKVLLICNTFLVVPNKRPIGVYGGVIRYGEFIRGRRLSQSRNWTWVSVRYEVRIGEWMSIRSFTVFVRVWRYQNSYYVSTL